MHRLTLALFVVSGAAGLIDQIAFSKYLSTVVGSTAYAVSAVLSSFMVGLALGAAFGGRFGARVRRPLVVYGALEIGVGVAVALAPSAFAAVTPLYVSLARSMPNSIAALSVLRSAFASLVVIVPTMAMGATLPLLSALVRMDRGEADAQLRGRRLGALYAANTLGGALGAIAAAYFVLPLLGLAATVRAAALASALVGVTAITFGRGIHVTPHHRPAESGDAHKAGRRAWLLSVIALASGWLVFACEVVFTHLLALLVGTSVYAFGLILAVFLTCLFAGAMAAPRFHARIGEAALPVSLGATALALALTLPLWDLLPLAFGGFGWVTSFAGRELVRASAAFALLVVPTTLMGLTFPLLLQRVGARDDAPRLVGRLTAINTMGAVLGSLATGYVALPALGSERSLIGVAVVFAIAAAVTAFPGNARRASFALVGAAAIAVAAMPRWDLARLTAGTNVYFTGYAPPDEVLFIREDVHGGVTTVSRTGAIQTLYTNGKFQGDDGGQMVAQRLFAHYPSLFVNRFESALVIGLGTATTVGTINAYPWTRVDLVEISPAIVEAAGRYFEGPNRGALRDPRVSLRLTDGRNFLLLSDARYDMISMELSSIWFAGAASLYSREFYQLVKSRLSDAGVFQQWVQLHHVTPRTFATMIHSLRLEFDHVALFYGGDQGMLIASHHPLVASRTRLAERERDPLIAETIPKGKSLLSLFNDVLLAGAGIDAYVASVARHEGTSVDTLMSSDDNLFLEYETPRGNVLPWEYRERVLLEGMRPFWRVEDVASLVGE